MSLADAFDLLGRNKSVSDDVFRGFFADPSSRYPAVRESIAAFQEASTKKRTMDKPALVAQYVRVAAILVEYEQHVQHLSVADWSSLVQFLVLAYRKLNAEPRDRTFVKNVYDLFRALVLLLEATESIDSGCLEPILSMCEDFCGPGQQRETSCHQFIMACVRILTQLRFEKAHSLGNRLIQIGKPRQERLRLEMFAFACLIPQTKDDLVAIGPILIDAHEVEFMPAADMGFPWFRPSPEADLGKFVAAKALSMQASGSPIHDAAFSASEEPRAKRLRLDHSELDIMASAFSMSKKVRTADLMARSRHSFWDFVVLSQNAALMARDEILDVWSLALDHLRYSPTTSGACFCLAQLASRLVEPNIIDNVVLARLETLLLTMGESSYPELSSGSAHLWHALSRIRVLDRDFQRQKTTNLNAWLSKSVLKPPTSLLTSFFGPGCGIYHVDMRGLELLRSVELFQSVTNSINEVEPQPSKPLGGYTYECLDVLPRFDLSVPQIDDVQDVRAALWYLAVLAHSRHGVNDFKPRINTKAVSTADIQGIVWFANLASNMRWQRTYFAAALALVEILQAELWSTGGEFRASLDLALALMEDPDSGLSAFVAGSAGALENASPQTALRSLQGIFQSYALQRSPFIVSNVLRLLDNPQFTALPEYAQLLPYLKAFISVQSPYSRLRSLLARLLMNKGEIFDIIGASSLDNAIMSIPSKIRHDDTAIALLDALPPQTQLAASFKFISRGASVAQVVALLSVRGLLSESGLTKIATLVCMGTPQDLVAALVTPLMFGPFCGSAESLRELAGSSPACDGLIRIHSLFSAPPKTIKDDDGVAAVVEEVMRGCSYLGSAEEKVECVSKCWLFVRAHSPEVPSEILKAYVKGSTALIGPGAGQDFEGLEDILNQLLVDVNSIRGYPEMAADIAYMGFQDLSKRIYKNYETSNSNIMRVFWSFDEIEDDDYAQFPVRLYELLRASDVTYEIWSLVIQRLIDAANHDLMAIVSAFRASSRIRELVGALQLWTGRLKLDNTRWLSFMGYMAAEVGNAQSEHLVLGEKSSIPAFRELETVQKGLPYSKQWHLHHFRRRIHGTTLTVNVEATDTTVRRRCPVSQPIYPVITAAARIANLALSSLNMPPMNELIFEVIPELLTNFVPLLAAASLKPQIKDYIKELLLGSSAQREMALRIVQRHYEATKSFMDIEPAIVSACRLSADEFAVLGVACVETMWSKERQNLSKPVMESLMIFYRNLQDPDLQTIAKVAESGRTQLSHLNFGSKWSELEFKLLSFEATGSTAGLQQSLECTGLWNTASITSRSPNFYDYEQAWWLQEWDLPPAPVSRNSGNAPHIDSDREIYGTLFNLFGGHCEEAESFAQLGCVSSTAPGLLGRMLDGSGEVESALFRQGRELVIVKRNSKAELARELCRFASQLRAIGELNDSTQYTLKLEHLAKKTDDPCVKTMSIVESSHTAWALGDQTLALSMLQNLIRSPDLSKALKTSSSTRSLPGDYTLARVYCRLGTWARIARQESDEAILAQYFTKAEDLAQEADFEQVFHDFAHFCDEASHDPSLREEIEDLERMRSQRRRELNHLRAVHAEAKAEKDNISRRLYHVQKALKSEDVDYTSLLEQRKQLNLKCIESYLRSLKAGDLYAEDMNRFVALWLELVNDMPVNQRIHELLSEGDTVAVLSRKFLPWMNQLSSRLGTSDNEFQRALQLTITTALQRHPFHTLWQLVNLWRSGSEASTDAASVERMKAAKALLERGRASRAKKEVSRLVRDLFTCSTHMVSLAAIPVDRSAKSQSFRALGSGEDRWWRREFVKMGLPVPTSSISPRQDGDYSNIPTVVRVGSEVSIAGGQSSPKIVTLIDSAGAVSHMVLKHSADDLRQDAIMQQVFEISNGLLASAKGKRLRVRTYNVIPLGVQDGAIEFVEGACSLQEVVEPLHKAYGQSGEYSLLHARGIMRDVQRADRATRIAAFKDIMAHTPPQMRRFWPKQMPDVQGWLRAKTTWCRSTAVMSIVGYVVGLGDRHCSNLLVDTNSGEVVHIDLGIAFDQGRFLSVPETVPFRLTRDVVDGMGVSGVDGPFTLAAQTTLALMREQQSRILTVLEVLKHDAIYSWRLPPLRTKRVKVGQPDDEKPIEAAGAARGATSSPTTGQAESALRSVKQKLSSNLNVEATVRDLVARARDTSNLALIYGGWSPFY